MDCTRSIHAFTPFVMYIIPCRWDHWRWKWQLTPAFLPGKSHGQGNPAGYSLWGLNELDLTERLSTHRWDHSADSNGSQLWSADLWELPIASTFREALESEGGYWVNGHEFEPTLGVGDGQGSLAPCSPLGRRESDMTERLNNRSWEATEGDRGVTTGCSGNCSGVGSGHRAEAVGCGDRSSRDLRQDLGLKGSWGKDGRGGREGCWLQQMERGGGRPRPEDSSAGGSRAAHRAPSGGLMLQWHPLWA